MQNVQGLNGIKAQQILEHFKLNKTDIGILTEYKISNHIYTKIEKSWFPKTKFNFTKSIYSRNNGIIFLYSNNIANKIVNFQELIPGHLELLVFIYLQMKKTKNFGKKFM